MKNNNKNFQKSIISFSSSIMAILAGLIFGLIILLVSNAKQASAGFITILQGGLVNGMTGIGQTVNLAVPIIMTGLAVGFAFRTGLFNIGAAGQFTLGSFVAVLVGIKFTFLPPVIHFIVALILAGITGGLWGFIPGFLKAVANVNEVISSIMTNYIGIFFVNMMIPKLKLYDQLKNQTLPVAESAKTPRLGLDILFPDANLDMALLIVIMAVVIIYIIIEKTTFGFELKACGMNKDASRYAGINDKKNIILAMSISGVLAGIGGALMYLGSTGKYMQVLDVIAPEGFNGISVALLGVSNPIGILFAGLFIAHITVGGYNLQLLSFVPEVIDMIVAAIIYCGAFSLVFKTIILKLFFDKKDKKEDKQ